MKRIDYKSGIIFAVATIPGAILGAVSMAYVPRHVFDIIFGVLMIVAGAFLWLSAKEDHEQARAKAGQRRERCSSRRAGPSANWSMPTASLSLRLQSGNWHRAEYIRRLYFELARGSAAVSSMCPHCARLLNFPVHIATATSHFVLAVMALTGTLVHIVNGAFEHGVRRTAILAVGVVLGAQSARACRIGSAANRSSAA